MGFWVLYSYPEKLSEILPSRSEEPPPIFQASTLTFESSPYHLSSTRDAARINWQDSNPDPQRQIRGDNMVLFSKKARKT